MNQRGELEKVIKAQKNEILEAERKAQDYYNQLLSTKENFQILHNEQKLLSDDLTAKQRELTKVERERLNLERELLQLRPLQSQLDSFSESNKAQIEANVRTEFERNKLQKQLMDLQNDQERNNQDYQEVADKNSQLTMQNQKLIEQLRNFEKESFELEARIKRGLEAENDNKNYNQSISHLKDGERELNR